MGKFVQKLCGDYCIVYFQNYYYGNNRCITIVFNKENVQKSEPGVGRSRVPLRQKRDFLSKKRWSDDLLPIGRMVKRGAIFRRLSMDGVFERSIRFGMLELMSTVCNITFSLYIEAHLAFLTDFERKSLFSLYKQANY